jgi:hypothetical protein
VVLGLATGLLTGAADARAGDARLTFPYHDADYLYRGSRNGGLTYVPAAVEPGDTVPLVVFLHGVNPIAAQHPWLGGRALPDLTAAAAKLIGRRATRPFLLAGPTQARGAMAGRSMWEGFDLEEFVDAVDGSLAGRATVDRDQIIVLGHSGAGCNPNGGMLRIAREGGRITPRALVMIDTCLDAETGEALGEADPRTSVYVAWQRVFWWRPMDQFLTAFRTTARESGRRAPILLESTEAGQSGKNPHEDVVEEVFRDLLPTLLPRL